MKQGTLNFDAKSVATVHAAPPNQISHNADPASSHIAAEGMTVSGKRQAHKRMVLDLCRRFPGSTAIELWGHASDADKNELREPQEVRRRLTDLLSDGAVRQGPIRSCGVRKTKMVTWEAI